MVILSLPPAKSLCSYSEDCAITENDIKTAISAQNRIRHVLKSLKALLPSTDKPHHGKFKSQTRQTKHVDSKRPSTPSSVTSLSSFREVQSTGSASSNEESRVELIPLNRLVDQLESEAKAIENLDGIIKRSFQVFFLKCQVIDSHVQFPDTSEK